MERIRVAHKRADYTVIDNGIFRDMDLSLAERGFLCGILALPDDWDFSMKGFIKTFTDGRDAAYSVVSKLIDHGYCKREMATDKKTGRFIGWEYTFYEVKNGIGCESAPFPEFPYTDFPDTDSPDTENPTQIKYLTNKVRNNKREGVCKATFVAPSRAEVRDYFKERGFASDPDEFWLHFENCDWRLSSGRGRTMKDWRLAAISWEKRESRFRR